MLLGAHSRKKNDQRIGEKEMDEKKNNSGKRRNEEEDSHEKYMRQHAVGNSADSVVFAMILLGALAISIAFALATLPYYSCKRCCYLSPFKPVKTSRSQHYTAMYLQTQQAKRFMTSYSMALHNFEHKVLLQNWNFSWSRERYLFFYASPGVNFSQAIHKAPAFCWPFVSKD